MMISRKFIYSILVIFSLLTPLTGQISFLEDNFYNQVVVEEGLVQPIGITFDEMGAGYIWLKRGAVMLLDTSGVLQNTPLIDISEEVMGNGDHGLLGFALDPLFLENGYFYLLYTVDRHHLFHFGTAAYDKNITIENEATIGRITRYQADQSTNFTSIVPDSRKVLVGQNIGDRSFPIIGLSHGIGSLVFGEDGTLMASCGDSSAFQEPDVGSSKHTFFEQALKDGIIEEKENIGAYKAQLVDNLSGKIIRIDAETGDGVSSNPFYDQDNPRAPRSRVWTLGFRNPYRFIFQPETGEHDPLAGKPGNFVIGDVGSGLWEEFNLVEKGGENCGWPLYEGYGGQWEFQPKKVNNLDAANPSFGSAQCETAFFSFHDLFKEESEEQLYTFNNPCNINTPIPDTIPTFIHRRPIVALSNKSWNPPVRATVGTFNALGRASSILVEDTTSVDATSFSGYSAIPGLFYQDGNFPETYQNQLFVGDFSGWMKVLFLDENNKLTAVKDFMSREEGIVSLTQNKNDGCIYYVHYRKNTLERICFGGNPPPVASIEMDKQYGASPLAIQFDASNSKDPFGEELSYFWDFGNGETSDLANPSFTFTTSNESPIARTVKLVVTDEVGNKDETEQIISINNTPPEVDITSFSDNDFYPISSVSFLPLEADIIDKEHSEDQLTYTWKIFLHHNTHNHPEPEKYDRISQTIISPVGCNKEPYWYRIQLEVTDEAGLSSYDEKEIFPYCDDPIVSNFSLLGKSKEDGNYLDWEYIDNTGDINLVELYRGNNLQEMELLSSFTTLENKEYTDLAPYLGVNYYQLKVYNANGVYDVSDLLALEYPPRPQVQLYPNPVTNGTFQLSILEPTEDQIYLRVYSSVGHQIATYEFSSTEGEAFEERINIGGLLNNGIYWYEVENGDLFYRSSFLSIE